GLPRYSGATPGFDYGTRPDPVGRRSGARRNTRFAAVLAPLPGCVGSSSGNRVSRPFGRNPRLMAVTSFVVLQLQPFFPTCFQIGSFDLGVCLKIGENIGC